MCNVYFLNSYHRNKFLSKEVQSSRYHKYLFKILFISNLLYQITGFNNETLKYLKVMLINLIPPPPKGRRYFTSIYKSFSKKLPSKKLH